MWKPNRVVSEHRRRAKAVWITLLITTLAYTVWQILDVSRQYEDPSTTLTISNEAYEYPSVHMCFMDGYGCHFDDSDYENCMSSMSSYLFFDDDFVETGEESHIAHEVSDAVPLGFPSVLVYEGGNHPIGAEEFGNCITFDLSALEADSTPASYETEATPYIWVYWTASTAPAEDDNYRAMVGIIVGDLDVSELTLIPYVRTEFPRTEDVLQEVSVVMIQKTHKTHLSGDEEDVFAIWSIATAESTPAAIEDFDEDEEMAIGRLALKIEQAPFSLVRISDDTPLNIGSLLGNIGGFWELLLVAWAVFFVSTRRDSEPEFKARDLADSIKKGKEAVGRRLGRPRTAASAQTTEPATELQPDWEAPYRAAFANKGSACGNASANGIAASDSSGQQSMSPSFWRRPVEHANPSRAGRGPPAPV